MSQMSHSADWQLELGHEVIAEILNDGTDFPWTYGKLIDPSKFDRFRCYFSDDDTWPETSEFDALLDEIRAKGGFILKNLRTGESFGSIRLNQEGQSVWFRHGDAIETT